MNSKNLRGVVVEALSAAWEVSRPTRSTQWEQQAKIALDFDTFRPRA